MQQPQNEGVATFQRTTVDGRVLSYRLKVVQQPVKARACGSGPRSSADRRPVDPPPVVKLTIYDRNEDITLRYDAGFMLYASLDVARPIASGRMHTGQIVPVLTGVAVAGVAYLERPKQAGYFIFPDLSVRHEGWYRLRFHLFEQVKHHEDADKERPFEASQASTAEQPLEPNQHEAMANRMYVYSAPFQVFSAKKFPGLNTSTELSKVVADQGCRVRIRREIRQRRKPKGKGEDEEERKSIHGTPEPSLRMGHVRSQSRDTMEGSRISIDHSQHLSSRRPSLEASTTPMISSLMNRPQHPISSPISTYPADHSHYRMNSESKAYAPSTPSTIIPRTMTPSQDMSSLVLPPVSALLGDAASPRPPRGYNLPDPTPQKRSYSPRTYSHDLSLKDGARPDALARSTPMTPYQPQPATSTHNWVMSNGQSSAPANGAGEIIEADNEPYDNSDSDDDSILNGPFIYRRADGTKSNKPLQSLRGY